MAARRFSAGLALTMACAPSAPLGGPARGSQSEPSPEGRPPAQQAPSFALEIHAEPVGVIYEYSALAARLDAGGGGPVALRLEGADMARAAVGPAPSAMIQLELTAAASARFRSAFPQFSETLPFRVLLGGEEAFIGVLYTAIGAAAIQTPVLHVVAPGQAGPVSLVLGAQQGVAYGVSSPEAAARLDTPQLREALRARALLQERREPLRFVFAP
ncbi:MAG: hypothetical protein KF718_20860 [Polyangiaceae bacterium]|nr:hypothetical protein [Polyangiaceae bacterium]